MTKHSSWTIILLWILLLISCKGPSLIDKFDVRPSFLSVSAKGGEFVITSEPFDQVYILVNGESFETDRFTGLTDGKTYSVSGGWISASFTPVNGEQLTTVKVVVEENKTGVSREATIIVSNVIEGSGQVKVKQSN